MANGIRGSHVPEGQGTYPAALGAAGKSASICSLGNKATSLALPKDRLGRHAAGIRRATMPLAIRAPCGKDGTMKRAARFKTGSVVFDKRRKTWNYLWWEGGKRRSRLIGTLQDCPTRGIAWKIAESLQPSALARNSVREMTVSAIAARYQVERFPTRRDTARTYRSWLRK